MGIPEINKIIANSVLQVFGGKPKVWKYWDDKNNSSIDILSTVDRPCDGVTSYSTIGLSDYSIGYTVDDKPLRLEIVGASATYYEYYPNILATCAFCIMNSSFSASPGAIFRGIVEMYYPNNDMKHVLFTSPFLWESLETLDFPDKKVTWLLAVPISENEYKFAQKNGVDALEKLFEREQIDIFNMERRTIL